MSVTVSDPNEILLQKDYDRSLLAEAILDRHYAALHYLAYSILGDADESDDIVQESILEALAKIDRYRPGSNMKAWLSTIVVNYCKDKIRRRKSRQRLHEGLRRLFGSKRPRKSPEDKHIAKEAKSALWSFVNQLDEKHRLPIILRYVHNMSIREVAHILQLREGTVHSRLHYACRDLGRQLALHDQEALLSELLNE
jgi:RNA polymerase sigma-70 factor (ECF subfamily)